MSVITEPMNREHYTITFDANGGTGNMKPALAFYGRDRFLPNNTFRRNGYRFSGWALEDGKDVVNMSQFQIGEATYKNKELVKDLGDITLYAVWRGGGAQAACDWAVRIANDKSFSHGKNPYASRCGCYFCRTNGKKKEVAEAAGFYSGDKWDKTYIGSTLINAAYAHGANKKLFLRHERKGNIFLSVGSKAVSEIKKKELKWMGRPNICDLKPGDILIDDMVSTAMYLGNEEFVECVNDTKHPFGKNTIRIRTLTKRTYRVFTDVFRVL